MIPIVDMHVHLGSSRRDGASQDARGILKVLEQQPITHALVFPIDDKRPGPSYRAANDRVLALAKKDKRILPVARLNPHDPRAAFGELKRAAKKGFRAVKLHPNSDEFYPYEAEDLVSEAEKLRLPVIIHTAHEPHCHPAAWEGICLRHRRIRFILTHAGKDAYREAAAVARKCANVYLDTSTLSFRRSMVVLQKVGAVKLVFGSDLPYSHPAIELKKWELILGGRRKLQRKIFWENPKKILGGLT